MLLLLPTRRVRNLRLWSRLRPGRVVVVDVFRSYPLLYHTQRINVYPLGTFKL